MDSTAYRYLIGEIHGVASRCSFLPHRFAAMPGKLDQDSREAIALFLGSVTALRFDDTVRGAPAAAPVLSLFGEVQAEVYRCLVAPGGSPDQQTGRRGTELLRLLCQLAHPRFVRYFPPKNPVLLARACFLAEACMNLEWCPNAMEGQGKRAAHVFFVHARKSLMHATGSQLCLVYCFLWSACALAQKTEGIRDCQLDSEKRECMESYQWFGVAEDTPVTAAAFTTPRSSHCVVVPSHRSLVAAPHSQQRFEGRTGLSLFAGSGVLRPSSSAGFECIHRPKIHGVRFSYTCDLGDGHRLAWTVVLQLFADTFYRMDILRPSAPLELTRAVLCIEGGEGDLAGRPGGVYLSEGRENLAVQLLENPLRLGVGTTAVDGLVGFTSEGVVLEPGRTTEAVTAWRRGTGVTDVERTHLLGIFEA